MDFGGRFLTRWNFCHNEFMESLRKSTCGVILCAPCRPCDPCKDKDTKCNHPDNCCKTFQKKNEKIFDDYKNEKNSLGINDPPRHTSLLFGSRRSNSLVLNGKSQKSCHYDENKVWSCCNWCEYVLVVMLAAILLIASITITIFWVMYYREGFAWSEDPKKQFNLHPVLMVAGFITFSGFSMLLYRICRCFRRIYVKLFHTIFHALAIPCIVVGFLSVFEYHNSENIPNFYSMHSWLGMVTMGLFGLQFVVGFFSFLLLLCCESSTVGYRASLVPVHAAFGLATFMLAIATCLTGLTEKAIFQLGDEYKNLVAESYVVNGLGMVLTALGIIMIYMLKRNFFKYHWQCSGSSTGQCSC